MAIALSRFSDLLNPGTAFKPDLRKQVRFLSHISAAILFLVLIQFVVELLFLDQSALSIRSFISSLFVSKLVCIAVFTVGVAYIAMIKLQKTIIVQKDHLKQGLFAMGLILILYIYGEQDRFLLSDNPVEDLLDFTFLLVLVTSLWAISTLIFSYFDAKFSHLNRSNFLILRGMALLLFIIPVDIFLNYQFLSVVYGFPLYEDYWVLEVPLKALIILLVNFTDKLTLETFTPPRRSDSIKVKIGNNHRLIDPENIAYILVRNQLTLLYTTSGEKLLADHPLSRYEDDLDGQDFFRASRQLLVSRKAIHGYQTAEGKRVKLNLIGEENEDLLYISRLNAPSFRRWMNGV